MSFACNTLQGGGATAVEFTMTPGYLSDTLDRTGYRRIGTSIGSVSPDPVLLFVGRLDYLAYAFAGFNSPMLLQIETAPSPVITEIDMLLGGVFNRTFLRLSPNGNLFFCDVESNPFTDGVPVAVRLEFR